MEWDASQPAGADTMPAIEREILRLPQQRDGSNDCGVHLAVNAELLVAGDGARLPGHYSERDAALYLSKISERRASMTKTAVEDSRAKSKARVQFATEKFNTEQSIKAGLEDQVQFAECMQAEETRLKELVKELEDSGKPGEMWGQDVLEIVLERIRSAAPTWRAGVAVAALTFLKQWGGHMTRNKDDVEKWKQKRTFLRVATIDSASNIEQCEAPTNAQKQQLEMEQARQERAQRLAIAMEITVQDAELIRREKDPEEVARLTTWRRLCTILSNDDIPMEGSVQDGVYGELTCNGYTLIMHALAAAVPGPINLVDLGSGRGKMLYAASSLKPGDVVSATGLECSEHRHGVAETFKQRVQARYPDAAKPVKLVNKDSSFWTGGSKSTHVFSFDYGMAPASKISTIQLLGRCTGPVCIATTTSKQDFEEYCEESDYPEGVALAQRLRLDDTVSVSMSHSNEKKRFYVYILGSPKEGRAMVQEQARRAAKKKKEAKAKA